MNFKTCSVYFYPLLAFDSFPNDKILDSSKLKWITDDNFKFDENQGFFGRQLNSH